MATPGPERAPLYLPARPSIRRLLRSLAIALLVLAMLAVVVLLGRAIA